MTTYRRGWVWLLAATLLLAAAVILGVMVGPAGRLSSANWNIIWNVRMPRVALAAIVGATLSLAGASYQGVFRNPLVDPYLLGAAGGAGLGATIVIAFVGIVVPHAVRMVCGSSYRRVLPISIAVGAAFLILADIPGRMLQNPAETPLGVVTAFCGVPFFMILLRTRRASV